MKRYIKHYNTNSRFNFLLKGMKFYYFNLMDLYVSRKYPIIYLKEFGDSVENIKLFNLDDNSIVPFSNDAFFQVHLDQYIIINYKDGTSKRFQLIKDEYGLMEFEQFG